MYIKFGKKNEKDWGAMLKQNKSKSLEELMQNTENVIEHLFNDHRNCNKTWCYDKCAEEKRICHK